MREDGADVRVDGADVRIEARSIVNATGPWLDRLRLLEDPAATPSIRLSKGVHLVVDGAEGWGAAVTIPQSKARVSFAIPWEGMLLLGTTDTLHEGEPEDATVTDDDVRTILDEAAVALHGVSTDVRASFCGLRVLPGGPGKTVNARRETVFTKGPTGMVSVAGGKLTTYRRIALDALEHAGRAQPGPAPPAASGRGRPRARRAGRSSSSRERARTCSISTARSHPTCSSRPARTPSLLEPIVAGRPDLRAQELYARTHEWAMTDDDVRRRRTTAWLAG